MTQSVAMIEDEIFSATCITKAERAVSNASTALTSPEMSRMTSPSFDSELEEIQELNLGESPDLTCEDYGDVESEKPAQKGNALEEISVNASLRHPPAIMQSSKSLVNTFRLGDYEALMLFCLTLGALCHCGYNMSIVNTLCIIAGINVALMFLPRGYLYIRHKDSDAMKKNDDIDTDKTELAMVVFWLAMYGLAFVYGLCVSATFRLSMGGVASLMILPGIYLFALGGCKPEDFDDECHVEQDHRDEKMASSKADDEKPEQGFASLWVAIYGLAFAYGLCISGTFRLIMGGVASMMVLPGIYLFALGGCRPEDFDDDCDIAHKELDLKREACENELANSESSVATLCFAAYGLIFVYGLCASATLSVIMGGVACLMILPGIYLFVLGGCKPEDFDDECYVELDDCDEKMASSKADDEKPEQGFASFWFAMYGLTFAYGFCISGTFRLIMGGVASMMVLPGIYLFALGGCRPEDFNAE